jgi:hypothetical protein
MSKTQSIVVTSLQVIGILLHLILMAAVLFNILKHVLKLSQKPMTILVFYFAATITLVFLIVAFLVI